MLELDAPVSAYSGVKFRNNLYYNPGWATPFYVNAGGTASYLGFSAWNSAISASNGGSDAGFADPQLAGVNQFQAAPSTYYDTGLSAYDYRNAIPGATSPAVNAGVSPGSLYGGSGFTNYTTNLEGNAFTNSGAWNAGAF